MGIKPRNRSITYDLVDLDHQNERHCSINVGLGDLTATLSWVMEINEDYLDDSDDDGPEGFSHDESIAFDSGAELARVIGNALRDLRSSCYLLYVGREEVDDVDAVVADLSAQTEGLERPGNAAANKVDVAALEAAYQQPLPEPLRGWLDSGEWRAIARATALDLPGETINGKFLGVSHPVAIDFCGRTLIDNAALYRKPAMCAFAKFVGVGLGITYYGVVQANSDGEICVTTRLDDVHCIAESPGELAEILASPRRIKRKGRVRRIP